MQKVLRVKHSKPIWTTSEQSMETVIQSANLLTRKTWKSWWVSRGVPSAAGNITFPSDLMLSGIAKSHIWLPAFWYCSKLGYLHWRQRVLCKGSWTHLNAVGRALVLPLSNLFTLLTVTGNCNRAADARSIANWKWGTWRKRTNSLTISEYNR